MILAYLRDTRSREIHKLKRNICPRPYSYTPTLVGLVLKTSRLTLVTLYTLGNLRISPHTSISVMHIKKNLGRNKAPSLLTLTYDSRSSTYAVFSLPP